LVLKRVDLTTGDVMTICTAPSSIRSSASWGSEDQILFVAGDPGTGTRIHAVSATGGGPSVVLQPDIATEGFHHWWPQFLPDGRRFLFGVSSGNFEVQGTWLSTLDPPHERQLVLPGAGAVQLSASGHLLYVRDGTLLAQPFDVTRGELTGEPSAVASSVGIFSGWSNASVGLFSISASGLLVYAGQGEGGSELAWLDRGGNRLGTVGEPGQYLQIQLSPDERRVVAQIGGGVDSDIWVLDLGRGVATRATSDPGLDSDPVWSADGHELFFDSQRGAEGASRLHRMRPDESGSATLLLDGPTSAWAEGVSPDGTTLVYLTGTTPNDSVWALPLAGDGEPELLMKVDSPIDEPQVSPDGRWLAYSSEETGDWETYVAPFRRDGPRVRVSLEGGRQPKWRDDGRELFFLTPKGQLMALEVHETEGQLEVGRPQALFNAGVTSPILDEYSTTKDGQRFLVITPLEESGWSLHAVLNWTSLLE
jgi:Tol biopolymer transport system component